MDNAEQVTKKLKTAANNDPTNIMTTSQLFLPKECLVRVAEFLDFDGLIHLRGATKMMQQIVLPILQTRAMSNLQKFRRFRFKSRRRGCPDMKIR